VPKAEEKKKGGQGKWITTILDGGGAERRDEGLVKLNTLPNSVGRILMEGDRGLEPKN